MQAGYMLMLCLAACSAGSSQSIHCMQLRCENRPYLAAVQLPYSRLTGSPGLELTGRMSGFRRAANCPAVQVKAPEVSEVFSKRNCGTVCRLGVGTTKSWATTYTLYSVLAVIPHAPALPQRWLKPQTGHDFAAGGYGCNSLQLLPLKKNKLWIFGPLAT